MGGAKEGGGGKREEASKQARIMVECSRTAIFAILFVIVVVASLPLSMITPLLPPIENVMHNSSSIKVSNFTSQHIRLDNRTGDIIDIREDEDEAATGCK